MSVNIKNLHMFVQRSFTMPVIFSLAMHAGFIVKLSYQKIPKREYIRQKVTIKNESPTPKVIADAPKVEPEPKIEKKPDIPKKKMAEKKEIVTKKVAGVTEQALAPQGEGRVAVPLGNTSMAKDDGTRLSLAQLKALGKDLSSDPKIILSSLIIPEYTPEAIDANLEMSVAIDVYLDEKGNVIKAELQKKVGYGMDDRILKMAQNVKFEPRKNEKGVPLPGWWELKTKLELR